MFTLLKKGEGKHLFHKQKTELQIHLRDLLDVHFAQERRRQTFISQTENRTTDSSQRAFKWSDIRVKHEGKYPNETNPNREPLNGMISELEMRGSISMTQTLTKNLRIEKTTQDTDESRQAGKAMKEHARGTAFEAGKWWSGHVSFALAFAFYLLLWSEYKTVPKKAEWYKVDEEEREEESRRPGNEILEIGIGHLPIYLFT
ncbi:hypothetical protein VNO77_25256 [Canavalia gladiata]|uniref:Uncharacterized protein n=1 Tax=Canavalia gladiata TaxID=3824 RepID=A0AAN9L952_CANGL